MNDPLLQGQAASGSLAEGLASHQNMGFDAESCALPSSPLIWRNHWTELRSRSGAPPCLAVWPTASHPKLLLPMNNLAAAKQGLHLYEPYSLAGKLSKRLLEGVIDLSALSLWSRGAVSFHSDVLAEVVAVVLRATGEESPCFALLHGGTSECSRITAQVMRPNGDILGYLKFSFTPDQTGRLKHEAEILQRLWTFADLRQHIPQVLFAGKRGGFYLVFLSALMGSPGPVELTPPHEQMLHRLKNVDPVENPGCLLIEQVVRAWEAVQCRVAPELLYLRDTVLKVCSDNIGRSSILCGVSHGDFAPWNTRLHDGQLAAFDWESSCWTAPVQWDVFHFYVQVAVCLNRPRRKKLLFGHPTEGSLLLLYLLHSIPHLLTKSTRRNLRYRTSLLKTQLSSPHGDEFWIA